MDGLVFLFVLFAIISSIVSKAKKTTQQATRTTAQQTAASARRRTHSQPEPGLQKSTLTAMERPDAPARVAQPRIHARVDEPYMGSLGPAESMLSTEGTASSEGADPCHDEQLEAHKQAYAIHDPETLRPAIDVVPNLASQQALVQAVVMSEILTRPALRRRA